MREGVEITIEWNPIISGTATYLGWVRVVSDVPPEISRVLEVVRIGQGNYIYLPALCELNWWWVGRKGKLSYERDRNRSGLDS